MTQRIHQAFLQPRNEETGRESSMYNSHTEGEVIGRFLGLIALHLKPCYEAYS